MSKIFFMMSEILRWDNTETFVATCEAFAQIEGTKNCSIADVNDLQDILIEKGFSISRLTPKPVSEEGWISVEDGLPEISTNKNMNKVQIFCESLGVDTGFYWGTELNKPCNGWSTINVTHWKLLPKPPITNK